MDGNLTPHDVDTLLRELARRRDADDIDYLLGVCGVTTVQDAQEIYERYHAQDVLTDQAVARIEHWLGSGSGRPGT